jgi:PIN domain nuclease of toxin-antitoxin system
LRVVLDASALLALILDEPGADVVQAALDQEVLLSVVNFAEVIGRAERAGIKPEDARNGILALPLQLVHLDEKMAFEMGKLAGVGRPLGLSLGDCACLATAKILEADALTADKVWAKLKIGLKIRLIR